MSDRDVLFRIGLADHPQTEQKLRGLADKVRQTMQQVGASVDSVGDKAERVAEGIPSQLGATYDSQIDRLARAGDALGRQGSQAPTSTSGPSPATTQRFSPVQPASQTSSAPRPTSPVSTFDPDASDEMLEALRRQVEGLDAVQKKGSEVQSQLSGNFREVASKAEESASGIGQLASGVAFLFAESESAKELVDTLLKIKGTADVVLGGFKALSGGVQVISLLRDRTRLLGQSQGVQAQQQRAVQQLTMQYVQLLDREGIELTQVTNGNRQHAAALRFVAEQARKAAAAEEQLARSTTKAQQAQQLASRAGITRGNTVGRRGRGAGLLGGVAGLVGFEAISAAGGGGLATGLGGLGIEALLSRGAVGGAAAAGGGAAAGGTGIVASVAAAAGPIAAAAAALGGVALAAKVVTEHFDGSATEVGSWSDTIGSAQVAAVSWVGTVTGAFDFIGDAAVANAEKLREANIADAIQRELLDKIRLIELSSARELRDQARGNRETVRSLRVENGGGSQLANNLASQRDIMREIAIAQQTIADFAAGKVTHEETYLDALQRSQTLSHELVSNQTSQIQALRQEAQARQSINAEAIRAGQQRLSLLDRELDSQKKIRETVRDQLGDAAVRFSELSQREQAEAIRAQRLAQSGRARELNQEQRELLNRVGTQNATSAVRTAAIQDATQAGFFQNFGQAERARIQQAAAQQQQLQQQAAQVRAEIVNRTQINVQIERDAQQITEQIIRKVEVLLNRERNLNAKQKQIEDQRLRARETQAANKRIAEQRGTAVN